MIERIFADLFEFFLLLNGVVYYIENNFVVKFIKDAIEFLKPFKFYRGNGTLAHVWGIVIGLILVLKLNTSEKIPV